jgi:hypothetical protein
VTLRPLATNSETLLISVVPPPVRRAGVFSMATLRRPHVYTQVSLIYALRLTVPALYIFIPFNDAPC